MSLDPPINVAPGAGAHQRLQHEQHVDLVRKLLSESFTFAGVPAVCLIASSAAPSFR